MSAKKAKVTKVTEETGATIDRVEPSDIKIGAGAVEAVIRGHELAADMEAAVCKADGSSPADPAILVEQPLPGDVTATRFPITITVPAGTPPGTRAVVMLQDGYEVARLAGAIELFN